MSFNVLVVEDNFLVRSMIVRSLRRSGLSLGQVFEAADGLEGLETLLDQNIDFVLVDINMPSMSGFEMVNHMRKISDLQKIPVVFISGEVESEIEEKISGRGDGFIQKPFDPNALGKLVMDLIAK